MIVESSTGIGLTTAVLPQQNGRLEEDPGANRRAAFKEEALKKLREELRAQLERRPNDNKPVLDEGNLDDSSNKAGVQATKEPVTDRRFTTLTAMKGHGNVLPTLNKLVEASAFRVNLPVERAKQEVPETEDPQKTDPGTDALGDTKSKEAFKIEALKTEAFKAEEAAKAKDEDIRKAENRQTLEKERVRGQEARNKAFERIQEKLSAVFNRQFAAEFIGKRANLRA